MIVDLSNYSVVGALESEREFDVRCSWPIGHPLHGTHKINVEVDPRYRRGDPYDDARIQKAVEGALARLAAKS